MQYRVGSSKEALALCRTLQSQGRADFFRGQPQDWPLLPSAFRKPAPSLTRLKDFIEWAEYVPQMFLYKGNHLALESIAQHYGMATPLLDLTRSPEVAMFFAQEGSSNEAVIYCFPRTEIQSGDDLTLVEIDVANLWRLEAQEGVFLRYAGPDALQKVEQNISRIYFPPSRNSARIRGRIYPARKSGLEVAIDEWLYRNTIETTMNDLTQDITHVAKIVRHSYPGLFRWRQPPDVEAGWRAAEAWSMPQVESVGATAARLQATIRHVDLSSPQAAIKAVRMQIAEPVEHAHAAGIFLEFKIEVAGLSAKARRAIGKLLHRVWDGLRSFPYPISEITQSLSLSASLVIARSLGSERRKDWGKLLWGETELVELSPFGGHISAGEVSKADLLSAINTAQFEYMTNYFRGRFSTRPLDAFLFLTDHLLLLRFEKFRKLFCEQYIPTAVDSFWDQDLEYGGKLDTLWDLSFNPTLLGYFTTADYRFYSPLGLEKDPERKIYILPDMTKRDLIEAFAYALPEVVEKNEPMMVSFHGWNRDERELWNIPEAVALSKTILEIGGISALEVFPNMRWDAVPKEDDREFRPTGMGAFDIWMMAKELIDSLNGKNLADHMDLFEAFKSDLIQSNNTLETFTRELIEAEGFA